MSSLLYPPAPLGSDPTFVTCMFVCLGGCGENSRKELPFHSSEGLPHKSHSEWVQCLSRTQPPIRLRSGRE